jgi:hypothetical protein
LSQFPIFPFFPEKNLTVFALNQSCDNAMPMKKKKKNHGAHNLREDIDWCRFMRDFLGARQECLFALNE